MMYHVLGAYNFDTASHRRYASLLDGTAPQNSIAFKLSERSETLLSHQFSEFSSLFNGMMKSLFKTEGAELSLRPIRSGRSSIPPMDGTAAATWSRSASQNILALIPLILFVSGCIFQYPAYIAAVDLDALQKLVMIVVGVTLLQIKITETVAAQPAQHPVYPLRQSELYQNRFRLLGLLLSEPLSTSMDLPLSLIGLLRFFHASPKKD